jgi:peroxiredoxin
MKRSFVLLSFLMLLVLDILAQDVDSLYAKTLLKPGTKAPDFTLKTPDGESFKLSSQRGRYVVIDFWASWCGDCRRMSPKMDTLSIHYSPDTVAFVGVSYDTDKNTWVKYLATKGNDFIIHVSELKKWKETETSKQYGINWIPSMYLIDPNGKVVMATTDIAKLEKALGHIDKALITSRKWDNKKICSLHGVTLPHYQGGIQALMKFLSENLRYPNRCERMGATGKVLVQFNVGKDGALDSVCTAKTDVNLNPQHGSTPLTADAQHTIENEVKRLFDIEAVRVVASMKNWVPGTRYGSPIRVRYTVPITFRLK